MNFNKDLIENNFSTKSLEYNKRAKLQKIVAKKLCQMLVNQVSSQFNQTIKNQKIKILDLGSGASFIAKNLFRKKIIRENCEIFELDLSQKMLDIYYRKDNLNHFKICADIENLPFAYNSFDIIISSFSLQWLRDYKKLFSNLQKFLTKKGVLAFSIPDDDSFKNLCEIPFAINKLPNNENILKILDANFIQKFYHHEIINEPYENAICALKSFKKIGVNYNSKDDTRNNLPKYLEIKKFYLKNFQNKINYHLDWSIRYYIYTAKS